MNLAAVDHSIPIEREFEAWIVAGMERYLENLEIPYAIRAVSPARERTWPADSEVDLGTPAKIVGIQFKRAYMDTDLAKQKLSRIRWNFHNPKDQMTMITATPNIYYCLPTFTNRNARREALQHCVFWRPDDGMKEKAAWYDNPRAATPASALKNEMRWGRFLESIQSCEIGRPRSEPAKTGDELRSELDDFYAAIDEYLLDRPKSETAVLSGLYILRVGVTAASEPGTERAEYDRSR